MSRRGGRAASPGTLERLGAGRGGVALVVAVALLANAAAFDPRLNTNGDNAQFLVLAESLLSGHGLAHVNSPGLEPHTKYPFLYPLLLAGVLALFPGGLIPAKLLSVALGVASCALLLVLFRRRANPALALAIALVAAVSPHLLEFSHITFSEIPYLFFSLLALLALERTFAARDPGRRLPVLALLAIMATYYVKSVALALALAAPIAAALRRRFRLAAFFLLGFALLSLPWYLRNKAVGQENLYLDYFLMKNPYREDTSRITPPEFVQRVATNVVEYERLYIPNGIVPAAFRGPRPAAGAESVLFLVPLALVAVGLVAALRAGRLVVEGYTLGFLAIIHVWPEVWSGTRFFLPILPLLIAYAILGVDRLGARVGGPRLGVGAALLAAALLAAANIAETARVVREERGYTPDWVNFFAAAEWIRSHTPPDAIIANRSSYILYWKTHRRTVGYPFTPDAERVFREVVESGARYVLVDNFFWTTSTPRYLVPALEAHRDRWRVVWASREGPPTYVLEMLPAAAATP